MGYYDKFLPFLMMGPTLDADTTAFLNEMDTAIDSSYHPCINNLVVGLKTAGLFTKLDGLYLGTLITSQQSRLNLVAPTGADAELNIEGSPSHTSGTGWNTSGNNANRLSMNTAVGSLTNYSQDSACFGVWSGTAASENAFVCGVGANILMNANYTGGNQYGYINTATVTSFSAGGGGSNTLHMMNRVNSSNQEMFSGGSEIHDAAATSASTNLTNVMNFLNANYGIPSNSSVVRAMIIGGGLTSDEHSDLYDLLSTFMTEFDAV